MGLSAGWVWVPGEPPQARVLREKRACRHDKLPHCSSSLPLPRLWEDGSGSAVVSAVALSVLICVYRGFDVHTGFQARLHGLRRGCHERQGERAGDHRMAHKFLGGENGLPEETCIAGFASAQLHSSGRNRCEILRASCQDRVAFLDDASRIIPHAMFFFEESAKNVITVLKEAIMRRGVPKKIFTDNGKIFRSLRLRFGCAALGIEAAFARPYSAPSKGKIEAVFRHFAQRVHGWPRPLLD